MTNAGFAVAIDGPVGVGKSTTARIVAEKLGMTYIDTGAMYRAVAFFCTARGVDIHNETTVKSVLKDIDIHLRIESGLQRLYLLEDNKRRDITDDIRTQEASENASVVAAHKCVREKLVAQQKQLAATGRVVMDGRDIGSHVLPWAQVKIYLDASTEIRAKRRCLDLEAKGQPAEFEKVCEETKIRDYRDKTRENSPLIRTPDAHYIDTGKMTREEVVDNIVNIAKLKEGR
ncbi:MAG: (d)CMP kinase [Defluviitaleaceae bacterium]|nr:(d)CMP kinase [Defluviitaleaceae bacterium]